MTPIWLIVSRSLYSDSSQRIMVAGSLKHWFVGWDFCLYNSHALQRVNNLGIQKNENTDKTNYVEWPRDYHIKDLSKEIVVS